LTCKYLIAVRAELKITNASLIPEKRVMVRFCGTILVTLGVLIIIDVRAMIAFYDQQYVMEMLEMDAPKMTDLKPGLDFNVCGMESIVDNRWARQNGQVR